MDWDNLKVFLAVARAGSIASAAKDLHLDQSTVSRRLRRLEVDFGTKLFKTDGGQRTLTSFGQSTLEHAERAEASVYDAVADAKVAQHKPSGIATISASSSLVRHALICGLSDLKDSYEGIQIQFDVSHEVVDLSRMRADIAIRLQQPKTGDYAQQKIGEIEYSVYRSKFARSTEDWIGFSGHLSAISDVISLESVLPKRAPLLRTNDPGISLEAIRTGLVAGALPSFVARLFEDVERVENAPIVRRDVWLVTRMDMKDVPHIAAAKAWVRKCIVGLTG